MADIELVHPLDSGNGLDVAIRQPMAGVQGHAQPEDFRPGPDELLQFVLPRLRRPGQGVLAGMQFDGVGAQFRGG